MSKQNKLYTKHHQVEEFENGKIVEETKRVKRTITFKKYNRHTVY